MSSARRLYRVHLALAVLGGIAVVGAALIAVTRLELSVPSGQALVAACRRAVPLHSSLAALAVVALATLGLTVGVLALRSLLGQLRDQRRILRGLRPSRTLEIAGHQVVIIAGERPRAFCAGLLRPRIYLSDSALERLSAAGLRAVLAHEGHHRANRDPLRILLAQVLADALFFLPGLRRLGHRYRELAELAADEAATRRASDQALASALLTFGESGGEASAVVGIAPERVDHLLGEPPRWRLPISAFGGSLVSLALLLAIALALPSLASQGTLSLAVLTGSGCMVMMIAMPLGVLAAAITRSRRLPRRSGA